MTRSANLGFPRIGLNRELKKALESYWKGESDAAALHATAAQLRAVESEEDEIGLEVEMVTRRIRETSAQGYLVYGYKFRPRIARETGR